MIETENPKKTYLNIIKTVYEKPKDNIILNLFGTTEDSIQPEQKKENAEGNTISDFKIHYRAIVIRTVFTVKNRHIGQQNKTKNTNT